MNKTNWHPLTCPYKKIQEQVFVNGWHNKSAYVCSTYYKSYLSNNFAWIGSSEMYNASSILNAYAFLEYLHPADH